MLGGDRQGRGGAGNPPTTPETKASGDISANEEMTSRLGLAALPSPQRGTLASRGRKLRLYRHPDGDNVAKPKCAIEYSLLELADPLGDPAAAEIQERRDIHKATIMTRDQDEREMETGDRTGQRALLARGMREDADKERTTLK